MKTLELENYGVAEMQYAEMVETDGGGFFEDLVRVLGVIMLGATVALIVVTALMLMGASNGAESGGPSQTPHNL